jgi:hypothetical protein
LKWAFSEAACLLARESDQAKRFLARKAKKHGKPKALGILAARLGRAVYHMLRQKKAFDVRAEKGTSYIRPLIHPKCTMSPFPAPDVPFSGPDVPFSGPALKSLHLPIFGGCAQTSTATHKRAACCVLFIHLCG